jgi:hypothetical protein
MILKRILICGMGDIDTFKAELTEGINLIKSRYAEEISCAIRLCLNHKISPLPMRGAGGEIKIEADVSVSGKDFFVLVRKTGGGELSLLAFNERGCEATEEYLYLTSHCLEHDESNVFSGVARGVDGLLSYLDEEKYYLPGELCKRTDGNSSLAAFRTYLRDYVKEFKTDRIREGKRYELFLTRNGRYSVRYVDGEGMPVHLSESESLLFKFLCFLKTAEFWRGFEEIRNLHGVKKPLLVTNFLERLDDSIDTRELLERAVAQNRQLIILTI